MDRHCATIRASLACMPRANTSIDKLLPKADVINEAHYYYDSIIAKTPG